MESRELRRFKSIILELHKSFPNGLFGEEIVKLSVITQEMRDELVNRGIFYKTVMGDKSYYTLGANGLSLVSSWKMEELTEKIRGLTKGVIVLTVIAIVLAGIGIVLSFVK